MTQLAKSQTNRLLGYPEDARLLIVNADDFGMCNSTNEAIIRTLRIWPRLLNILDGPMSLGVARHAFPRRSSRNSLWGSPHRHQ